MSEELEVLKTVARRLDEARIAYMLTGSIALNYYAVPRMTRDVDVVVELGPDDADRVIQFFEIDFYVDPDAVRRAIVTRGMFNLIHDGFVVKVDFIIRKDSEYRREEFARRHRVEVEGNPCGSSRPRTSSSPSWIGCETLARKSSSPTSGAHWPRVPDLDEAYLARWTGRLGLAAL